MCRLREFSLSPLEKRFPLGVKRCTNYITIVAFNSRAAIDIDVACFSVLTSPSRERNTYTRTITGSGQRLMRNQCPG